MIKTLSLLLLSSSLLYGQINLSATLDPIEPSTPQLVGGGNPPLVTVSIVSDTSEEIKVPVYNARIPRNVPIRFHVSEFPVGVKGVHYSLQSVGGGITGTNPNRKQQFVPPSLNSDPFTLTALGPDAVVVWYPHENDPNPIETANQLMATQQRLPFVVVDSVGPSIPNSITRVNNTYTTICSGWRMVTLLDLTVTPVTFGIKNLLCIYDTVTGGTNVSCSIKDTVDPLKVTPCFNPVTILVP